MGRVQRHLIRRDTRAAGGTRGPRMPLRDPAPPRRPTPTIPQPPSPGQEPPGPTPTTPRTHRRPSTSSPLAATRWGRGGAPTLTQIEPATGLRSVDRNNKGYSTTYTTRPDRSVVCRGFIPAHGHIARRRLGPRDFPRNPAVDPLRFEAPGTYSYPSTVCGADIAAFRHGF